MKRLKTFLKQLFCLHEWHKEYVLGYVIDKDGWLTRGFHWKCDKCGKTRSASWKQ